MFLKKIIIAFVLIAAVAGIIYLYLPGYSRYQELRKKEIALQNEIERITQVNNALEEEIDLLRTNITHLEKVLRDEMGLVKPGEVVYKIVEEVVTDLSETGVTTAREAALLPE